jgi:hypothetical protein
MRFSLMIHSNEYVIDPREPSHDKNMTFQLLSMLVIHCFAFSVSYFKTLSPTRRRIAQ